MLPREGHEYPDGHGKRAHERHRKELERCRAMLLLGLGMRFHGYAATRFGCCPIARHPRIRTTTRSTPGGLRGFGTTLLLVSRFTLFPSAARLQRSGDLVDRRLLGGADLDPVLPMGRGDLVGQGDNEPSVLFDLLGSRLALEQRHRIS